VHAVRDTGEAEEK